MNKQNEKKPLNETFKELKMIKFKYRKNKNDIKERKLLINEDTDDFYAGFDLDKIDPNKDILAIDLLLDALTKNINKKILPALFSTSKQIDKLIFFNACNAELTEPQKEAIYILYDKYIKKTKKIFNAYRKFKKEKIVSEIEEIKTLEDLKND